MNNLTQYESYLLNESAESGPMGFVISFTAGSRDLAMSYTVAGIYDTFYDFAQAVNEDLGFGDDDEDEPTEFKDVEELMTSVFNAMEIGEGDYQFWHGFSIRSGADGYHSESNENCYKVSDMLEKLFVNPKEIMMGSVNNSFNIKYLARSIEKDPEKLLMYEDDQEMYDSIIRLLNWDKKKLDAVLKVNRIKNQF
jgi:hypothetical protein